MSDRELVRRSTTCSGSVREHLRQRRVSPDGDGPRRSSVVVAAHATPRPSSRKRCGRRSTRPVPPEPSWSSTTVRPTPPPTIAEAVDPRVTVLRRGTPAPGRAATPASTSPTASTSPARRRRRVAADASSSGSSRRSSTNPHLEAVFTWLTSSSTPRTAAPGTRAPGTGSRRRSRLAAAARAMVDRLGPFERRCRRRLDGWWANARAIGVERALRARGAVPPRIHERNNSASSRRSRVSRSSGGARAPPAAPRRRRRPRPLLPTPGPRVTGRDRRADWSAWSCRCRSASTASSRRCAASSPRPHRSSSASSSTTAPPMPPSIAVLEAVRRRARVRVFGREHGGVSAARNRGVSRGGGPFLTFLDSDDLMVEHRDRTAARALARIRVPTR